MRKLQPDLKSQNFLYKSTDNKNGFCLKICSEIPGSDLNTVIFVYWIAARNLKECNFIKLNFSRGVNEKKMEKQYFSFH